MMKWSWYLYYYHWYPLERRVAYQTEKLLMMLLSQSQLLGVGVKPFVLLLQTTKPNFDAQTQDAQKQLTDQDLHVQLYTVGR